MIKVSCWCSNDVVTPRPTPLRLLQQISGRFADSQSLERFFNEPTLLKHDETGGVTRSPGIPIADPDRVNNHVDDFSAGWPDHQVITLNITATERQSV